MKAPDARAPVHPNEREFLPAALEILDTPASPAGRAVAVTIGLALLTALAWSAFGRVDIVATATGMVIPSGRSKVVQPLEAGVVRRIMVHDGDHVRAGQTLIELDSTVAASEAERLGFELRQSRLHLAALRVLRQDLLDGSGLSSFAPPDGASVRETAVSRADAAARRDEQLAKLASLAQQQAQKAAELASNEASAAKLATSIPWLEQKETLRRQAMNIAFGNRAAWLDAAQGLADARGELAVQQAHQPEIKAAIGALRWQAEQARAAYAHDVLKDLAETEQHAGTLAQQLVQATHKAGQAVLTAPIGGTVQQLVVHTVGGVVTPAEALLTVVPEDGPVLLEVEVENADIGFVRPGQDVAVKVQTFEFTRYGLLRARVLDVSRDRVGDHAAAASSGTGSAAGSGSGSAAPQQGGAPPASGYVAHLELEQPWLVVDGTRRPITPGMAVTAEIKIGARPVISYLLSPLQRTVHEGGRER